MYKQNQCLGLWKQKRLHIYLMTMEPADVVGLCSAGWRRFYKDECVSCSVSVIYFALFVKLYGNRLLLEAKFVALQCKNQWADLASWQKLNRAVRLRLKRLKATEDDMIDIIWDTNYPQPSWRVFIGRLHKNKQAFALLLPAAIQPSENAEKFMCEYLSWFDLSLFS